MQTEKAVRVLVALGVLALVCVVVYVALGALYWWTR